MSQPEILYCHCTYAQVVPPEVREAVLQKLCESGRSFEAVADLCELSARKDASLIQLVTNGPLKIAACYPRALKWLFASAGAPLDAASTEILNMRAQTAEEVVAGLLNDEITPNLPAKIAPSTTPEPVAQP